MDTPEDDIREAANDESAILHLEDGKYTIIRHKGGRVSAMRYEEPWRDLTGDKLVGALIDRMLDAEAHLRRANHELIRLKGRPMGSGGTGQSR